MRSDTVLEFVFCVAVPHAETARILITMNLAGQLLFLFVADYIHWGQSTVTAAFALSYLTVSLLQVSAELLITFVNCDFASRILFGVVNRFLMVS
jgi:ABC-type thiamin/hydroxymethylpyrimidine transport system permease subunit